MLLNDCQSDNDENDDNDNDNDNDDASRTTFVCNINNDDNRQHNHDDNLKIVMISDKHCNKMLFMIV